MVQTWVQVLADHHLLARTFTSCEPVDTSLHCHNAVA